MSDKKILIVDADLESAKQIAATCRDFNYKVGHVKGGEDLLEAMAQDIPDIVIIGMVLSDGDGLTLCDRLRSTPEYGSMPLILMGDQENQKAFESHRKKKKAAHAYFLKPLEMDDLMDQVERLIGLPPAPSSKKKKG